ncbi:hypothetical protein [Nonomuraea rubra]|uniref:hypothetical protein n=1 Tax=Nonomuraea rubra TaxID=46180 RepID=UPI0033F99751
MTTQVAKRSRAAAAAAADDEAEQVIEPVRVIPPELKFTTRDKAVDVDDEAEREIEFELDDEVYTIIRPNKLDEVLAQLIEAGARRATTADALYAGARFMQRVIAPESLERLQRRLDDDTDPFRITDLYDILERIVQLLDQSNDRGGRAPRTGPAPRRRARR